MRDLILSGGLSTGSRLPVTRQFAKELGVSRNVVLVAYEELIASGYATARRGSGTFVAANVQVAPARPARRISNLQPRSSDLSKYARRLQTRPESYPSSGRTLPYDFDCGAAAQEDCPIGLWRKLASIRWRNPSVNRADLAGEPELRSALATYLKLTRGVECEPDQIVIVNGSAQALDLTARVLLAEGDVVILEDPHYHAARDIFQSNGARLHAVRTDEFGMVTGELPRLSRIAKLAYVTPSHQFPSGGILPLERRLALLEWATRNGAFIVEDDYDSEYLYGERPVEAMQGIDRAERVIYLGTFSRALSPAMRLGYLVLPKALVRFFAHAKHLSDSHSPVFTQQVIADFIRGGHLERHIRRSRIRKMELRAALLAAIEKYLGANVSVHGAHSGSHLLLSLPHVPADHLDQFCASARSRGLGIYSARRFYLNPPPRSELVMGYNALTKERIVAGIRILGELLRNFQVESRLRVHSNV